jgi:hypothetical protein
MKLWISKWKEHINIYRVYLRVHTGDTVYCTYNKSTWAVRKNRTVLVFHNIVFRVYTNYYRIRLKCPFVSEYLPR